MGTLKESSSQLNVSVKTEGERLVIAKEVVIKSLLPVVFENVPEGEREEVFNEWYGKLLTLIKEENVEVKNASVETAPKKPVPAPEEVKAEARPVRSAEPKATEKQIKKIFALGHSLGFGKEELEEEAEKISGVSELSKLDKWQASKLIDSLDNILNIQEIYG